MLLIEKTNFSLASDSRLVKAADVATVVSAAETIAASREPGGLQCPTGHMWWEMISRVFSGSAPISFSATSRESAGCRLAHSPAELYFSLRPRMPRSWQSEP